MLTIQPEAPQPFAALQRSDVALPRPSNNRYEICENYETEVGFTHVKRQSHKSIQDLLC